MRHYVRQSSFIYKTFVNLGGGVTISSSEQPFDLYYLSFSFNRVFCFRLLSTNKKKTHQSVFISLSWAWELSSISESSDVECSLSCWLSSLHIGSNWYGWMSKSQTWSEILLSSLSMIFIGCLLSHFDRSTARLSWKPLFGACDVT